VKITKKIEVKKWQLQKNKNKDFSFQSHRQIQVKKEEKRREGREGLPTPETDLSNLSGLFPIWVFHFSPKVAVYLRLEHFKFFCFYFYHVYWF
jgi:hypothetical protein